MVQTGCHVCQGQGDIPDRQNVCKVCSGKGHQTESASHHVDIPAGIGSLGQTVVVTINKLGNKIGSFQGDLNLYIDVQPDPSFSQEGLNLIYTQDISYSELCLGAELSIPLPDKSSISINIPAGTDLKKTHHLKGKGITNMRQQRGDFVIKLNLAIPKNLTSDQKDLLNQLKLTGL